MSPLLSLPTSPRARSTAIGAVAALALLALAACGRDTASAGPTGAPPTPVAAPALASVPVSASYPAYVEAIERVELRPQVSGYLERVAFQEGDRVERDALLFRIDPRPYAAAVQQAEASLRQARAEAEAARREGERARRLVEMGAVSREEADRRVANAEVAQARIAGAEAALNRARLDLRFTEVRAPIAGRIGRAEVTAGNLVGPQTRLGVVVRTDPLYLRFDVDERTLAAAATPASQWQVGFRAPGQAQARPATLAFLDNELGDGTATRRVRARIDNPDDSLTAGGYGTAILTLGTRANALLVRESAIGADQGKRYVLVVGKQDTVEYRPVEIGALHDGLREVTAGLKAGERIVVNGLMRLRPGAPIAPRPEPMQPAPAAGAAATAAGPSARSPSAQPASAATPSAAAPSAAAPAALAPTTASPSQVARSTAPPSNAARSNAAPSSSTARAGAGAPTPATKTEG